MRVDVLEVIKSYSRGQPGELEPMANALVKKLEVIKVRVVD